MIDQDCPFCAFDAGRIFFQSELVVGIWDAFPISPGHALLIPRRHIATWFDASQEEQQAVMAAVTIARETIEQQFEPAGYNIGINVGNAGGQTIDHLHVHLIPRYIGDVENPRGGVRHVIPKLADYLAEGSGVTPDFDIEHYGSSPHDEPLLAGGRDALLPHLRAHLDKAIGADFAVAFVMESGLNLVEEHLVDLLERGGSVRIVTGDYLGVTEPRALRRLNDLQESYPNKFTVKVFEAGSGSFHPKSYILKSLDSKGVALVGSSNLSKTALTDGVEWNLRASDGQSGKIFSDVLRKFDGLWGHPQTKALTIEWINSYEARRSNLRSVPERVMAPSDEPVEPLPTPHPIQEQALKALRETRDEGNKAGLVVMATGLGKTWLAAFDTQQLVAGRTLFVAHREEILRQAMRTFRKLRPTAHLGIYNGEEKEKDADVVFGSIQTLGRQSHLKQFSVDEFDYIVIDEFHHAAATTYRRLIDYFEPAFLLGLTATPERTDGGDLLALCQENLVFRCDLAEGIRQGLLSPFQYFGVPDEVDYENIPWRSSRFDEEELTKAVATQSRAQNALEQFQERAGLKALGFCCSQRHADFMRSYFKDHGIRAAAVHSGENSDPRALSLEQLSAGELDIIFSVDMFNEGVDVPDVDTVMMLRPSESRILWLQQLGRGLRKSDDKDHLTVIDYIGNHRTFLLKPQTLFNLPSGDLAIRDKLLQLEQGEADLPPGCDVTYDLQAVEILRGLLRHNSDADTISYYYKDFKERHGRRPAATEMYHEGYSPRNFRSGYGSWFGFVLAMGDLGPDQVSQVQSVGMGGFLKELEITRMSKSLKMIVLSAMLDKGCLPGAILIEDLSREVQKIASRSAALKKDFSVSLQDDAGLRSYLEKNPIAAWTGNWQRSGKSYFSYNDGEFVFSFDNANNSRPEVADLIREIVDWRLAEYLDRPIDEPSVIRPEKSPNTGELLTGKSYMRADIAPAFGLEFSTAKWNQGYVAEDEQIFLLVTMDKEGMADEHQYGDRFLSRSEFEWISQNRHSQTGTAGQKIRRHKQQGISVHLLIRRTKKIGSKAAPFVYCGEVDFQDWEGNKPITVRWRLKEPLSDNLAAMFSAE